MGRPLMYGTKCGSALPPLAAFCSSFHPALTGGPPPLPDPPKKRLQHAPEVLYGSRAGGACWG
eukprot:14684861-Alexandrium_andersonii.AAC.1